MVPSPRGQKTRSLTHRTLATLGLLGLLSAGVVVGHSSDTRATGTACTAGGITEYGGGGNGSDAASAIEIRTKEQLFLLSETSADWGKHFVLKADLNIEGCELTPIGGDVNAGSTAFSGSFDGATDSGGTHSITGLIVDESADNVGLFGVTSSDAEVKNLTLIDVTIRGNGSESVAAVVGLAKGPVTNVHVASGRVEGGETGDYVGGLVGESEDKVSNSTTGEGLHVEGRWVVGGLIGLNFGTLESSASNASVKGENQVGGAVGNNPDGGVISDSHASGDVTIASSDDSYGEGGGFAGANFNGNIDASSASGDVVDEGSNPYVGGFVGYHYGGNISNSFAAGNVSGDSEVGGFAGTVGYLSNAGKISDSYSTGGASGGDKVGGFVGNHQFDVGIENSYSLGRASGETNVGGFAGKTTATVANSFWDTETSGLTTGSGATGKTTEEMTSIATFNDTATEGLTTSWAIVAASAFEQPTGPTNEIWGIGAGVNCGYPFLYWQTETAITCDDGSGGSDSSEADGSTSASGSSPEKQASSPAIHLDLQATVGQQVEGAPVIIGGQGLAPGSTMTLVVRSTPQTLATGTMSALGNFSTKINLPALPSGSHTLTLTGTAPDGSIVTLTQGFTISTTGTFTALDTVASGQTVGLAATGPAAHLMWSGIAGLGLVFAGLALTAAKNGLRGRQSL